MFTAKMERLQAEYNAELDKLRAMSDDWSPGEANRKYAQFKQVILAFDRLWYYEAEQMRVEQIARVFDVLEASGKLYPSKEVMIRRPLRRS